MIYLTLPELMHVAGRVLGPEVAVRDYGLLEAALARPGHAQGSPGQHGVLGAHTG